MSTLIVMGGMGRGGAGGWGAVGIGWEGMGGKEKVVWMRLGLFFSKATGQIQLLINKYHRKLIAESLFRHSTTNQLIF